MKKPPPFKVLFDPKRIIPACRTIQRSVFSLLFPWGCPGCQRLVSFPNPICDECASRLKRILSPFCHKCGSPLPEYWKVEVCPECRTQKSALSMIRSVYYYEQLIQEMILEVKYARRARYLRYLSEELFKHVLLYFPGSFEAIVPVPLHREREWERTFNQAALMADQLSRLLGVPVWKALRKPRKTLPQSSLSGTARRCNLKGAFECKEGKISFRSVLLIDDVITTGATLQECGRVLRKSAGVKKVYAITVARAVQQF